MSNTFMNNLQAVLGEEYNTSITENGAVGYRTTGKELLDLNFSISSLRNMSEEEVIKRFEAAFIENKMLAVKWLFYAADVRGGVGERKLFRTVMKRLANTYPEIAKAVLCLVPVYSRWDNLWVLLDTKLKGDVIDLVKEQLSSDLDALNKGLSTSLLGKWMPSLNASSTETKRYARILCSGLELTDRNYRKMLSKLRSFLKVVEVDMSSNHWDLIDYTAVPSRANLLYRDAFYRHDEERRKEFLASLERGETKINAGVLFPHDIVSKYTSGTSWRTYVADADHTIEELWKALPDYVKGSGNTICVRDGSGSMKTPIGNSSATCLDVATALSIYFAERSSGQFKDKFITFSKQPQLVDMSNCETLREKILTTTRYTEVANTNIEAVFDLILYTAQKNNMTQEELPQNILILSDMEFDECAEGNYGNTLSKKLFNVISEKYKTAGYKLPRLVFWNINSRTNTIPVKENDLGVALVSGYSPAIVKMVLSNSTDPMDCLLEQINSTRYDAVQEALETVIH